VVDIDPVPADYDIIIVSAMYATYAEKLGIDGLDRIYTVSNPVYFSKRDPKPVEIWGFFC